MWDGDPSCKCPRGEQDGNEDQGSRSMKSRRTAREFDSVGTGGPEGTRESLEARREWEVGFERGSRALGEPK